MPAGELTRPRNPLRRGLRVKPALRALGLPDRCRWPEASRRLREMIVGARRADDTELAVALSELKAFLKRNLPSECRCGAVIAAGHITCRMHSGT